jgi:hypothetical protein
MYANATLARIANSLLIFRSCPALSLLTKGGVALCQPRESSPRTVHALRTDGSDKWCVYPRKARSKLLRDECARPHSLRPYAVFASCAPWLPSNATHRLLNVGPVIGCGRCNWLRPPSLVGARAHERGSPHPSSAGGTRWLAKTQRHRENNRPRIMIWGCDPSLKLLCCPRASTRSLTQGCLVGIGQGHP